jgi:hypothetical protein
MSESVILWDRVFIVMNVIKRGKLQAPFSLRHPGEIIAVESAAAFRDVDRDGRPSNDISYGVEVVS